jgi:serine/threonine-protein kinase RsbW
MPLTERFVIGNQRSEVSAFSDRFEDWCTQQGVASGVFRAFQVAFDELLTNVIDYALANVADPSMEVIVRVDETALSAEVVDNGAEFDPLAEAEEPDLDLEVEDRPIGGLGIHLVRNLMDEVRYERVDGHNHFFMSKRR